MNCKCNFFALARNSDELDNNEHCCNEINYEARNSRHYHSPHLHVIYSILKSKVKIKLATLETQGFKNQQNCTNIEKGLRV